MDFESKHRQIAQGEATKSKNDTAFDVFWCTEPTLVTSQCIHIIDIDLISGKIWGKDIERFRGNILNNY